MNCHDARELFSALVDDALDPTERSTLDAHLAGCAECRRELERFRATVALLRAVEPARAPAGFVDRVLEAARPAPLHHRLLRALFLPWPVKLPLEAAAIVLVGVMAVMLFRETPEPPRAARDEPAAPAQTPAQKEPAASGHREGRAKALADEETDRARRRDLARAAPTPAPATERRTEAPAAASKPSTDVPSRLSALRATAADVSGRLVVKDRERAARALAELVAKAGGTEVARRVAADATEIELAIPRAAWDEFVRGLERLGAWSPEREPVDLPTEIRVALRIAE
jgi:hypothetical protein